MSDTAQGNGGGREGEAGSKTARMRKEREGGRGGDRDCTAQDVEEPRLLRGLLREGE